MFDYLKKHKGEPEWIKAKTMPKIAEYQLKLMSHNGSGFDSWIILNIRHT